MALKAWWYRVAIHAALRHPAPANIEWSAEAARDRNFNSIRLKKHGNDQAVLVTNIHSHGVSAVLPSTPPHDIFITDADLGDYDITIDSSLRECTLHYKTATSFIFSDFLKTRYMQLAWMRTRRKFYRFSPHLSRDRGASGPVTV